MSYYGSSWNDQTQKSIHPAGVSDLSFAIEFGASRQVIEHRRTVWMNGIVKKGFVLVVFQRVRFVGLGDCRSGFAGLGLEFKRQLVHATVIYFGASTLGFDQFSRCVLSYL